MIKGLILFEEGGVQQVGELFSLAGIIATMKQILPELEARETQRVFDALSNEELEKLLAERKK